MVVFEHDLEHDSEFLHCIHKSEEVNVFVNGIQPVLKSDVVLLRRFPAGKPATIRGED